MHRMVSVRSRCRWTWTARRLALSLLSHAPLLPSGWLAQSQAVSRLAARCSCPMLRLPDRRGGPILRRLQVWLCQGGAFPLEDIERGFCGDSWPSVQCPEHPADVRSRQVESAVLHGKLTEAKVGTIAAAAVAAGCHHLNEASPLGAQLRRLAFDIIRGPPAPAADVAARACMARLAWLARRPRGSADVRSSTVDFP